MKQTREQFVASVLDKIAIKEPTEIHDTRKEVVSILKKLSRLNRLSEDELDDVLDVARKKYGSKVAQ